MSNQTTLANSVQYTGIGLHSGRNVSIEMRPAAAGTGITFLRVDLPGAPQVKATAVNVTGAMRATTLEDGAAKIFTVEHLLAALFAMGVDNCLVEINSVEPPVADGSALPFAQLMLEAGIAVQEMPRSYTDISQAMTV